MHARKGLVLAFLAPLIVLAIQIGLAPALGEQAGLLPFTLAVIAAAWLGGIVPGATATAFSTVLGIFFFIPPSRSFAPPALPYLYNASLFISTGLVISYLFEALHAAHRREREQQFRLLADSIPQLVWMARPDGYRFWFNARWYEYTGLRPSECIGDGWLTVHSTDDAPKVMESWSHSLTTGEPWECLSQLRRHDDVLRWHLVRAIPVHNGNGEIVSWFGSNTDVTAHIEAEQVLKDLDRRKDEFLAMLAHELRNPLSALVGAAETWTNNNNDPVELASLREIVLRQAQHINRLVEDLSDLSRIRQGKLELRFERVVLDQVIRRAGEVARPYLDGRRHQLVIDTSSEPIYVEGDETRLTQLFSNLVNNAAKYTPPEGRITVMLQADEDHAAVRVRDTGHGITPENMDRIFDMFQQIHPTAEDARGGMGIGLTLVKRLVELHHGSIEVHSDGPGKGSEFTVHLPLLQPTASSTASQPAEASSTAVSS